jgi:hypothetical protein
LGKPASPLQKVTHTAPRVLVLVPTRELAAQVLESVRVYGAHTGLRSLAVFGGVGINPQIQTLRRGIDILVATPGRLLDHLEPAHRRPVEGADPRPRRSGPHVRHGLHPRHSPHHRKAAESAGRT